MAKKRKKTGSFSFRRLLLIFLVCLLSFILIDVTYYTFIVDVHWLVKNNPNKTAFMKFRERQWKKQNIKIVIRQSWVSLSRISKNMQRSVVISEDAKFWMHDGFDFEAIQYAIEKNIKERKFKIGASTITQQVAKNLYLSPVKTPLRKINEAILTWRLERELSKKRILEIYLNIAEMGVGIFGVDAASRKYFSKPASQLTPREASLLAAILPNPIRFSPLRPSRYVTRRSLLIQRIISRSTIITTAIEHAVKDSSDQVVPAITKNAGMSVVDTTNEPEILTSNDTLKSDTINP